jgi:hypothetical protein
MSTATVSIVIPNYNGKEHLRTCLSSVARQSVRPLETLLIDDASTDNSLAIVAEEFAWVTVIRLPENRQFVAAVNAGIRAAKGEYIGLLNSDTEVDPDWVSEMVQCIKRHPDAGSIASKMVSYLNRSLIDAAGDVLTRSGAPMTRGHGKPDAPQFNREEPVFGACAGAALYRRDLFATIGLFDEDFIAYFEDADLAFRAQLAGFSCIYAPQAICYHKRNATNILFHHFIVRQQERNLVAFYAKNFPLSLLLRLSPFIFYARSRQAVQGMLVGSGGAIIKGAFEGLRLLPRMLRKRGTVQKMRNVPISHLREFMRKWE